MQMVNTICKQLIIRRMSVWARQEQPVFKTTFLPLLRD
jgi:hypothetical protein